MQPVPRRVYRFEGREAYRRLVDQVKTSVGDLASPLLVVEGTGVREPLYSVPGVFQFSVDSAVAEVAELSRLGVRTVCLSRGEMERGQAGEPSNSEGVIEQAAKAIRAGAPEMTVIAEAGLWDCLPAGECLPSGPKGPDESYTREVLGRTAVSLAKAGAHAVATADVVPGRTGAIRSALDAAGLRETLVLVYSASYASRFCRPREGCHPFQLDPLGSSEAIAQAQIDLAEGADLVVVRPALLYLDMVWRIKTSVGVPVVAHSTTGEYALLKASALRGWTDEKRTVLEALLGMRRAGADLIITHHAKDAAQWLAE